MELETAIELTKSWAIIWKRHFDVIRGIGQSEAKYEATLNGQKFIFEELAYPLSRSLTRTNLILKIFNSSNELIKEYKLESEYSFIDDKTMRIGEPILWDLYLYIRLQDMKSD